MEQTIRHKEIQTLRTVISSLDSGVVVSDLDGKFLLFNPAAEQMLGIGAKDLDPSEWTDVYGCFYSDQTTPYPYDRLPLSRALKGEEIVDDTIFIKNQQKPSGAWICISGKPLRDEKGSIWAGMVVFRDITQRKLAEQSFQSTSTRFSTLVDKHESAILVESEDRRILQANQAFCNMFGFSGSPADLMGMDCSKMAEQAKAFFLDPQEFTRRADCLLRDKTISINEKLYMTDGRALERDYIPVFNDDQYRGHVWQYRDVSKLDKAHREIKVYERLCTALEQTADSVVITDRQGIIEYVNLAFETTTGYSCSEALGKTPGMLKSGKHDEDFYRHLWSELLAGRSFKGTIVNRNKSGDLYWAQQTITPVKNEDGEITHFVSVLKDITELLKKKEQEANMRLAREIQQRFYRPKAAVPGFEIAGAAITADETGGDYYDFISLPDGKLCIVIGDVSGHGIGAALVMAETRAYVRSFSESCSSVDEILARTNLALAKDLHNGRFVTLLLCCLDPHRRTLVYACAGHDPGYLLDQSGNIDFVLEATGPPLGLLLGASYGLGKIENMKAGQILLLMTDGITESAIPDGTMFECARAIEYVTSSRENSASDIAAGLCQASRTFSGNKNLQDDISAVILKVL